MVDPDLEEMSGCRGFSEPLGTAGKEVNVLKAMLWSKVFLGQIDMQADVTLRGPFKYGCTSKISTLGRQWIPQGVEVLTGYLRK